MDKQQIYAFLREKGIEFRTYEHKAVYTIEEADTLQLPNPEYGAKNLFLRDDKKRNYYLITVRDELPLNLKKLQEQIGSRRLGFASEEDLYRLLELKRGSVTPLGLLNDSQRCVKLYMDAYFKGRKISVHPNENTASVHLACDDLMELVLEHGNAAEYLQLLCEDV